MVGKLLLKYVLAKVTVDIYNHISTIVQVLYCYACVVIYTKFTLL